MIFTKLAHRYLPHPKPLRDALAAGQVHVGRANGVAVYIIARQCLNKEAVKAAIAYRNAWVLTIATVEGTALALALAVILYLTARL